jgi:hypothetical protein
VTEIGQIGALCLTVAKKEKQPNRACISTVDHLYWGTRGRELR